MSDNDKPAWAHVSLGNILALAAVVGGTVAVYTEIRSNQAVEADRITVLARQLEMDRSSQQAFSEQMRAQLTQLSKDISYLQGIISTQAQKK